VHHAALRVIRDERTEREITTAVESGRRVRQREMHFLVSEIILEPESGVVVQLGGFLPQQEPWQLEIPRRKMEVPAVSCAIGGLCHYRRRPEHRQP
jgi:hypothetical protein